MLDLVSRSLEGEEDEGEGIMDESSWDGHSLCVVERKRGLGKEEGSWRGGLGLDL